MPTPSVDKMDENLKFALALAIVKSRQEAALEGKIWKQKVRKQRVQAESGCTAAILVFKRRGGQALQQTLGIRENSF